MQTDRLRIALRRRVGLEAIDLGFALVRDAWRPLLASWLGIALPLAAVVIFALREHPFWAIVALWWLRPVFGRVPLHVLARSVFSQPSGWLDSVRALPALARSGLGTSLFLQRLSPARSFLQPVLQLEGLRGRARRDRCRVLARRDLAAASALLSVAAHATAALVFGLLLLLEMLVPDELGDPSQVFASFFGEGADAPSWSLLPALYFLGVSCVEPLVVAGGFALYLNRRVELEGWDIDLAFRNLAARIAGARAGGARATGLVAASLLLLAPIALRAQAACEPGDPGTAKSCIESLLRDPEFGHSEMRSHWALRDFGDDEEEPPSEPWLPEWLSSLLATGFELSLWAGLVVLVIATLVALARRVEVPSETPESGLPRTRFGLDLDPRSLPADLLAAARAAFDRGDPAGALSLLYRGALVRLVERDGLAIPESATELECLTLVQRATPERSPVFGELTSIWLAARYAAEPPSRERFEALCGRFAPVFMGAAP